jgi:hypothetical protein
MVAGQISRLVLGFTMIGKLIVLLSAKEKHCRRRLCLPEFLSTVIHPWLGPRCSTGAAVLMGLPAMTVLYIPNPSPGQTSQSIEWENVQHERIITTDPGPLRPLWLATAMVDLSDGPVLLSRTSQRWRLYVGIFGFYLTLPFRAAMHIWENKIKVVTAGATLAMDNDE